MKISDLLNEYKKYNKENEAIEFLIREYFNLDNIHMHLNDELKNENEIRNLIEQYVFNNIPVQYIIGHTYFYGYKFIVNKNVLIPRFETEELVEKVIQICHNKSYKIADVGTGSGCIAISLKKQLPLIDIDAIDISKDALDVAKQNAKLNKVEVNFLHNDLLGNLKVKYDIIVSNPPYIDYSEEVMSLVYDNEPHLALFSNGLYFYEQILKQSLELLKNNGYIFFEISDNKRYEMEELIKTYYHKYTFYKDLEGKNRIVVIKK